MFCVLFVISLGTYFTFIFKKGSGYLLENCYILSNSCIKTDIVQINLYAAIGKYFAICNSLLDSLVKSFSQEADTLLKWLSCGLRYSYLSIH